MKGYQSLAHTRWDCKYHVVFIPKKRKKKIFGVLRRYLGAIFRELAKHKEVEVVEGHLNVGSCAYMSEHTAEVRGLECGRVHQRQERTHHSEKVWWSSEEFHRRGVLGKRLFRIDGRIRRSEGQSVHPQSRGWHYDQMKLGMKPPWAAQGFSASLRSSPNKSPVLPGGGLTFSVFVDPFDNISRHK